MNSYLGEEASSYHGHKTGFGITLEFESWLWHIKWFDLPKLFPYPYAANVTPIVTITKYKKGNGGAYTVSA